MANDSSTGGLLVPSAVSFIEDAAWDAFVQAYIVGVTQLPGSMVRPMAQPEPPAAPPAGTNWCGFICKRAEGDAYGTTVHDPEGNDGQGSDTYMEHETVEIECQFYGNNARSLAKALRTSLRIPQNNEYWRQQEAGYYWCGELVAVPSLVKERYLYRTDLTFAVRRKLTETVPVLNVTSFSGTVTMDNNGNPANGVTETINAQQTGD